MQHTLVWVAMDSFILDWKCAEIFSVMDALNETFNGITANCVLQHDEIGITGTVFSLFIDQLLFLRV